MRARTDPIRNATVVATMTIIIVVMFICTISYVENQEYKRFVARCKEIGGIIANEPLLQDGVTKRVLTCKAK